MSISDDDSVDAKIVAPPFAMKAKQPTAKTIKKSVSKGKKRKNLISLKRYQFRR